MKVYLLFLALNLSFSLAAQSNVDFGRTDEQVAAERLTISGIALTDYIHQDIPTKYKDQLLLLGGNEKNGG